VDCHEIFQKGRKYIQHGRNGALHLKISYKYSNTRHYTSSLWCKDLIPHSTMSINWLRYIYVYSDGNTASPMQHHQYHNGWIGDSFISIQRNFVSRWIPSTWGYQVNGVRYTHCHWCFQVFQNQSKSNLSSPLPLYVFPLCWLHHQNGQHSRTKMCPPTLH